MKFIEGNCYKEKNKNQNLIYQVIDNQPLPEKYRDKENEELYKNDQSFLIVDLLEKDISRMFFGRILNTKNIKLIPASEKLRLYKAAELIYNFQDLRLIAHDAALQNCACNRNEIETLPRRNNSSK